MSGKQWKGRAPDAQRVSLHYRPDLHPLDKFLATRVHLLAQAVPDALPYTLQNKAPMALPPGIASTWMVSKPFYLPEIPPAEGLPPSVRQMSFAKTRTRPLSRPGPCRCGVRPAIGRKCGHRKIGKLCAAAHTEPGSAAPPKTVNEWRVMASCSIMKHQVQS